MNYAPNNTHNNFLSKSFIDTPSLKSQKTNTHFLLPSEFFVTSRKFKISTILGTCVSICLFDPTTKISGMNHYMLPEWNGEGTACSKYGNIAIKKIVSRMEKLGANRNKIVAKIFGGQEIPNSMYDIGKRNSAIADVMLKELKTKIIVKQVGGIQSRKVVFDTFTGDVYMKYI